MKVAVTGATGQVGRQVVRAAIEAGHEVNALCRTAPEPAALRIGSAQEAARWLPAPLNHERKLRATLQGSDVVIHCAAMYSYRGQAELDQVNVEGTQALVRAAAEAGVGRIVVTSSAVTCGSTPGPSVLDEKDRLALDGVPAYYRSKARQEAVAQTLGAQLGVEVITALPTVVIGGPWGRLTPSTAIVVRWLLDPLHLSYPGGCTLVRASEVGAGHIVLAERGLAGERYILGGERLTWRTLHTLVAELVGWPAPPAEAGATVAWLAGAAAEAVATIRGEEPLTTRAEAATVGRYYWYSSERALSLGFRAGSARESLAETIGWLLVSSDLPRWVREQLRPGAEVRRARALVPRPLP